MICRMWTGFAPRQRAHLYEQYLREDLFPRLKATISGQGYRGYQILTRVVGDETEFRTLVWFTSLDAIKSFSGDDFERAVITEKASLLLSRWEEFATHYELADEQRAAGASA